MQETWRWFGPQEPISLDQIKRAGAMDIVSALYDICRGEPWPTDEVLRRKGGIESAGLVWSVVERTPDLQKVGGLAVAQSIAQLADGFPRRDSRTHLRQRCKGVAEMD